MRQALFAGVMVAMAALSPLAAGAQTPAPAPPAAAPGVNPTSEALVRRYLKAIHFEQMVDNMMASVLPLLSEQTAKDRNLTADQRDMITSIVRDTLREDFTPKMIEKMAPIYAETFTQSELEAIVAFYESPAGQAIMAKTPSLAPKSAQVARDLMPDMQKEVMRRLCAKIDCLGAKPVPPKSAPS